MQLVKNVKNFNFKEFLKVFSVYFLINFITRVVLTIYSFYELDGFFEIITSFFVGFLFDFITLSYIISLVSVLFFLFIRENFAKKLSGGIFFALIFTIANLIFLFNGIAEYFFWEEFTTRFNFLAVDYIIYTNELVQNSIESYPVYRLLFLIFTLSILITFLKVKNFSFYKKIGRFTKYHYPDTIKKRFLFILPFALLALCDKFFIDQEKFISFFSKNHFQKEISKNGIHELFSAFFTNKLEYDNFYPIIQKDKAKEITQKELNRENFNIIDEKIGKIENLNSKSPEKRKNVIFILSESMSLEFMYKWKEGNSNIVPYLTKMADNGIFFTNFYATGTRTVRGIEATTLSIPPTPGPSLVRRRHLPDLYSIGSIFKERNYDLKFIYGGNAYFDNMGEYFSSAGFEILDSKTYKGDENTFSNAWGHCDGDGYTKIINEADKSYKEGKKFFSYFLTTSNHRPFTFPDGKIIKQKGPYYRPHAVKYADHALGEFLEQIKKKPWYKDTIIVYVADHCYGAGGRFKINYEKYRIPFVIYGEGIKSQKITKVSGQIDVIPTLLNILKFKYNNKFFGQDILSSNFKERAFVSTFQVLGYREKDKLLTLFPKSKMECYNVKEVPNDPISVKQELVDLKECDEIKDKAIAHYQYSSGLFNQDGYYFLKKKK